MSFTGFEVICRTEAELPEAASRLLRAFPASRVFAVAGPMGAGKTTFIKVLCRLLGVTDPVQSPTFSIVNEYKVPEGGSIYHFDFYRIRSVTEAFDIGYEDYLYSGSYCFIEWPEVIEELLPSDAIHVSIEGEGERILRF